MLPSFRIGTRAQSVTVRISIPEVRRDLSELEDSCREDFVTALQEQQQRIVAALETAESVEAAPITLDDEILSCEEYVTLVYELHHVHLPELQAAGVVDFDRREETVLRGPRFNEMSQPTQCDDDR